MDFSFRLTLILGKCLRRRNTKKKSIKFDSVNFFLFNERKPKKYTATCKIN